MSTLQQLLNLGLVDIGSEDSRFEKMEAASAALSEDLKKMPALIIPSALISVDSDVDEEDPVFLVVEKQVIKQWKTMRNTHVNRPRELFRSVILQALCTIADGSPETAAVIWQTVAGLFKHKQVRLGKEADLVVTLINGFGRQSEEEAAARACQTKMPPSTRRAKKKSGAKEELKLKPSEMLKAEELLLDVARSAGPQTESGQALKDPNPHWPNQAPAWANNFSPRMTAALVKAVNLGMQRVSASTAESLQAFMSFIEARLTEHLETVESIREELLQAQQASQVRIDVLWWSEAKYSTSLMKGYQELPKAIAPICMAYDLSQIVPALSPASVTYILGETVTSVFPNGSEGPAISIETLLKDIKAHGGIIADFLPPAGIEKGRVPLFSIVEEALGGNEISPSNLRKYTGIDPTLELAPADFAMWVFRDIQARRLVEEIK